MLRWPTVHQTSCSATPFSSCLGVSSAGPRFAPFRAEQAELTDLLKDFHNNKILHCTDTIARTINHKRHTGTLKGKRLGPVRRPEMCPARQASERSSSHSSASGHPGLNGTGHTDLPSAGGFEQLLGFPSYLQNQTARPFPCQEAREPVPVEQSGAPRGAPGHARSTSGGSSQASGDSLSSSGGTTSSQEEGRQWGGGSAPALPRGGSGKGWVLARWPRERLLWEQIRAQAQRDAGAEPLLSSFMYASILAHDR
jgi:hypothetical protein